MKDFWLCFVPLFIAVDAAGVLPLYLALTEGMDRRRLHRVILQSIFSAALVAVAFIAVGHAALRFLGITIADFMVAGGVLLLAISLSDLLSGEKKLRQVESDSLGAVPLGVPLITGPAVLTTSLLLGNTYGKGLTAAAILLNVCLVGLLFLLAQPVARLVGRTGTKMLSKIASLLLAAYAVMLIRKGIVAMLGFINP